MTNIQEQRRLKSDIIKAQNIASRTGKSLSTAQALVLVMKARESK